MAFRPMTMDDVLGPFGADSGFRPMTMDDVLGQSGSQTPGPMQPAYRSPPGWVERYLTAPMGRGFDRAHAFGNLALGDEEGFAEQQRQIADSVQLTPEDQELLQQANEADTFSESLKIYLSNPRLIAAITTESLGLFTPALLGTAAAGAATGGSSLAVMAAMAAGSYGTEYLASIEDSMASAGTNLEDSQQVADFLANDELMEAAREKAHKRGIPIAAFDALSMGIAGRFLGLARQGAKAASTAGRSARALPRYLAGSVAETGTQMAAGGAGEAAAQLYSEGKITSKGEIVAEALGELGPGAGETIIGALSRRNRTVQPDTPPPTTPTAPSSIPPGTDIDALIEQAERGEQPAPTIAAPQEPDQQVLPLTSPVQFELQPGENNDLFAQKANPPPAPPAEPTDAEVLARMKESAQAAEAAEAETEIEETPTADSREFLPKREGSPMTQFLEAHRGGVNRRARELWRKNSGTKKAPAAVIKPLLVEVATAFKKSFPKAPIPEAPRMSTGSRTTKDWATYFDAVVEAVRAESPRTADRIERALVQGVDDAWAAKTILENLPADFENPTNLKIRGTQFESIEAQYDWTVQYVDRIFAAERTEKTGSLKETDAKKDTPLAALRGLAEVIEKYFYEKLKAAPTKSQLLKLKRKYKKTAPDMSFESFLVEQLAKEDSKVKTPKYFNVVKVGDRAFTPYEILSEVRRAKSYAHDPANRVLQSLYEKLKVLGKEVSRPNAELAKRSASIEKIGKESTREWPAARTNPPPHKPPATSKPVPVAVVGSVEALRKRVQRNREVQREVGAKSPNIEDPSKAAPTTTELKAGKQRRKKWVDKKPSTQAPRRESAVHPVRAQSRRRTVKATGIPGEGRKLNPTAVRKLYKKHRNILNRTERHNKILDELLHALRLQDARGNPLRNYAGMGFWAELPFFSEILRPGTDFSFRTVYDSDEHPIVLPTKEYTKPEIVASLRLDMTAEERKQFDALIDVHINLPRLYEQTATTEEVVVSRTNTYPVVEMEVAKVTTPKLRKITGRRDPRKLSKGQEIAPFQENEARIKTFLQSLGYYDNEVIGAAVEYANTLRTIKHHGSDSSRVILEDPGNFSAHAMYALGSALNEKGTSTLGSINLNERPIQSKQVLVDIRNNLKARHPYRPLLTAIINTGVDPRILVAKTYRGKEVVGGFFDHANNAVILAPPLFERWGDNPAYVGQTLKVLTHEMVHAATWSKIASDNTLYDVFENMRKDTIAHLASIKSTDATAYGLKDVYEFVAEAFANPNFQRVLAQVPVSKNRYAYLPGIKKVWAALVDTVRRLLSISRRHSNMLETVLRAEPMLFEQVENAPTSEVPTLYDLTNIPDKAKAWAENVQMEYDPKRTLTDSWEKTHLALMSVDTMERNFRGMMDRVATAAGVMKNGENPVTTLFNAIAHVSKDARDLSDRAQQISVRTAELEENARLKMFETMQETTMAGVDPTIPLANQAWLKDKQTGKFLDKAAVKKALEMYAELGKYPGAQQLYADWKDLLQQSYYARRSALLVDAMHRLAPDIPENTVQAVTRAKTMPEFEALLKKNGVDVDLATQTLIKNIFDRSHIDGPYFPLRRVGKFVTVIESDDINEAYFAMHPTLEAAKADAERLGEHARYGRKSMADLRAVIGKASAVSAITNKLDALYTGRTVKEKEAAKALNESVKQAAVALMAERVLYSSQLKRKGIAGARPKDMGVNLQDYVASTINGISGIETTYLYERALNDMQAIEFSDDKKVSPDDRLEVSLIRSELLIRAKEASADRTITPVDRWLGTIGFLNYLGAPSYWILNATQTAVVGVPVLAGLAKLSYVDASAAMGRAMKTLRSITKGKGWKALDDLNAVLDSPELSQEQREVIDRLISDNIIQATIANEFGLLMRSGNSLFSNTLNVLQKMPEMIERWNRLSMAIAATESGLGINDYAKIRDIVQSSQFNYDTANRGRLLKYAPEWLGGGGRQFVSPMMMFKVFGINMAELLYGNLYDGFINSAKTAEEKAQARKIFAGLIGTHTLAGGVVGGLGVGLAEVIVSAVNTLLDDEDKLEPEEWLDRFLSEHTNDYIARLVMRGLPAAVGVDFSSSVNLGNLLYMSRDVDWAEYGGVEQSVYSLLGPVAQYFSGGVREIARFVDGEASIGDLAEKVVPLKFARSLMQTWDYGTEGLETRQGQTFYDPSNVDIGDMLITALGLRPAALSQQQLRFYADRSYSRALETRKSGLMADFNQAASYGEKEDIRHEIDDWNQRMRESRNFSLIIGPKNLQASAKARAEVDRRYGTGTFTEYNR